MRATLKGFSLLELLLALSVLAILSAILFPKYISVREKAVYSNVRGQLSTLESVTQNWLAVGGERNDATAVELLQFLALDGSQNSDTRLASSPARDNPLAQGSWYISINTKVNVTATPVEGFNYNATDGLYYYLDGKIFHFVLSTDSHWSCTEITD